MKAITLIISLSIFSTSFSQTNDSNIATLNGYCCGKITKAFIFENPKIILSNPDTSKTIFTKLEINYGGFTETAWTNGDTLKDHQLGLINKLKDQDCFWVKIYLISNKDTSQLNTLFFELSQDSTKMIPCMTELSASINGLYNLELTDEEIMKLKKISITGLTEPYKFSNFKYRTNDNDNFFSNLKAIKFENIITMDIKKDLAKLEKFQTAYITQILVKKYNKYFYLNSIAIKKKKK